MVVQLGGRAGCLACGGPGFEYHPRKNKALTPLTHHCRCQSIIWLYAPYHARYELELELIQSHITQKHMLLGEEDARALRVCGLSPTYRVNITRAVLSVWTFGFVCTEAPP